MWVTSSRTVHFLLLTAVISMVSGGLDAAEPLAVDGPAPEHSVVHIDVSDRAEIDFLARWIDIWDADERRGKIEAAVDAEDIQLLRDFGFHFVVDAQLTEKYGRPFTLLDGQTRGIPGYPCYRTVEETLADGAALEATYPDLAEWIDIGDSWEKTEPGGSAGFDLMVLRLTNETNGIPAADKPDLWVMGSIHARELVSPETVTRFAEHLLANYDLDSDVTWLLDEHELHLLLVTNPDGRKQAETGLWWRKNTNENYCSSTSNDRGADLNRNFGFQWGCCGGSSGYGCDETYRGPSAASEPETQAVQAYVSIHFTDWRPDDDLVTPAPDHAMGMFIDVHSHGGDVFAPFGFQDPPVPNDAQLLRLGRKLSYFTGYDAQLGGNYAVDGSTTDFGYGRLGLPAFTFELGNEFFQDCATFESTIYPDNLQALLYAARAIRAPYTQSSGPEVVAPTAVPSTPMSGETVTITVTADDTRYGPGDSSPPTPVETIAAVEFYVNEPPWVPGAMPNDMLAVDGVFDGSIEDATALIHTAGTTAGRNTVYFRARDSAGYWGTVRSLFFWVLDPVTAAHVAGQLTDAATGLPIEGIVQAGPFSTSSEPATGSYDLMLPAGTYDVTASAVGYVSRTSSGVVIGSGETISHDFSLSPVETLFFDDVEAGLAGWTAEGSWAITDQAWASPSHSWTDSPDGDYGDEWEHSLISPPLDLTGIVGVTLEFSQVYEFETSYDYGHVEASADGGSTWTTLLSVNGFHSASWEPAIVEAPVLDNAADARIRFRLDCDLALSEDGWHLDDIAILGYADGDSSTLFADGFESGDTSLWSTAVP